VAIFPEHDWERKFIIRQPPIGEKISMIVKTLGSQMGSPAAAERGNEAMGEGRGESGERSKVQARSPKARSRSREGATLDEVPRISQRVS